MENFQWLWNGFLAICAAIVAIGSALKYVKGTTDKMKEPYKALEARVKSLEEKNEENRRSIAQLEDLLKTHINDADESVNNVRQEIKDQIQLLREQIEANESDTKLILKEIVTISQYLTSWDKDFLADLKEQHKKTIEHVIDEK